MRKKFASLSFSRARLVTDVSESL